MLTVAAPRSAAAATRRLQQMASCRFLPRPTGVRPSRSRSPEARRAQRRDHFRVAARQKVGERRGLDVREIEDQLFHGNGGRRGRKGAAAVMQAGRQRSFPVKFATTGTSLRHFTVACGFRPIPTVTGNARRAPPPQPASPIATVKLPASDSTAPLSYRDAGVDIDAGDALVERIKPFAKRTMRPEVLAGIGGFGALFEIAEALPRAGAGRRHRRRRHQAQARVRARAGTTPSASTSSR